MAERIIANSVTDDTSWFGGEPCWLWLGKRKMNRAEMYYGCISIRENGRHRSIPAHRAAVVAWGRRLLRSHVVRHLCNNTLCVNPAHLKGGTQSTNMRQCYADGRSNLCELNRAAA